jgi:hypothetical protein
LSRFWFGLGEWFLVPEKIFGSRLDVWIRC